LLDHRDTIASAPASRRSWVTRRAGRSSFGKKLTKQRDQLGPERDVDVGKRLVEQERARFSHESARESNALALASGEMRRTALRLALQPDPPQ